MTAEIQQTVSGLAKMLEAELEKARLEEKLRELESENAALKAEIEKNRRVLGQVKVLVEGYPTVPPSAYAQPKQEASENLKDAVERLDPYTRKIYNFLLKAQDSKKHYHH